MRIVVYKGQYGFSTLAKNGEDKMYIQVQFKKGQEPAEEKVEIKINDGFFSMYKTNVGLAKPKLVVLNYETINDQGDAYEDPFMNSAVMNDDDLPF